MRCAVTTHLIDGITVYMPSKYQFWIHPIQRRVTSRDRSKNKNLSSSSTMKIITSKVNVTSLSVAANSIASFSCCCSQFYLNEPFQGRSLSSLLFPSNYYPSFKMSDIVVMEHSDLIAPAGETNPAMLEKIEQAFGSSGYGVIAIRGVPDFVQAKMACLTQAYDLAHLPAAQLQELEDPVSLYNAGWSHGKEMLKDNKPDLAKASFYFNPVTDIPGSEEDRAKFPVSYPLNKWPTSALPTLEPASKRLGCLMKDVAVHLSKYIDTYAQSQCPSYPPQMLYNAMKDTEKVKGRLLYYYPLAGKDNSPDSWIGFHNDSGYLTALAGDIYLDPSGNLLKECPSPDAGLYVEDRHQKVVKVTIPSDCMAIQMGECTQIVTGGAVVATPHCVKGAPDLVRVSLACFIDVPPSTPVSAPAGTSQDAILAKESKLVPPLAKRWHDGMTFGDFLGKTFQMYYEWNESS